MASPFDTIMSNTVSDFLALFGDATQATYTPNGSAGYAITVIQETQWVEVPAVSADTEYHEVTLRISARSNTEGRVSPLTIGFNGQAGDTITFGGKTGYVVRVEPTPDAGFHRVLLRTKCIPYSYETEALRGKA